MIGIRKIDIMALLLPYPSACDRWCFLGLFPCPKTPNFVVWQGFVFCWGRKGEAINSRIFYFVGSIGKLNSHWAQVCYFRCSTHINIELTSEDSLCVNWNCLSFCRQTFCLLMSCCYWRWLQCDSLVHIALKLDRQSSKVNQASLLESALAC